MASPYECELRFIISDINEFKDRLKNLNAKVIFDYEFTDYYYVPDLNNPWNPNNKNLRLREWKKPKPKCEILFTELEIIEINGIKFKRSIFKEGKVRLYEGNLEESKKLMKSLGFSEWFSIEKKNCTLYEIQEHKFKTIHEFIPNFGWTGELEVEGADPKKAVKHLKEQMNLLGLTENDVTSEPLSIMYAKKLGFLNKKH